MSAIALVAGDAHPELTREIARSMGTALVPVSVSAFADGETRIRIEAEVRDADLYIVQPTSAPTNERLIAARLPQCVRDRIPFLDCEPRPASRRGVKADRRDAAKQPC